MRTGIVVDATCDLAHGFEVEHDLEILPAALVLVLSALALGYLLAAWIVSGKFGSVIRAIRDDETAAVSCGINLLNYKVIAFAISAAFGAVGGSFFARWVTFLSPDMFKFWESFLILCMIVLGGM